MVLPPVCRPALPRVSCGMADLASLPDDFSADAPFSPTKSYGSHGLCNRILLELQVFKTMIMDFSQVRSPGAKIHYRWTTQGCRGSTFYQRSLDKRCWPG